MVTLPPSLREILDDPEPDSRRDWITRLPAIVATAARRWSLTLGPPYEPGGTCSWVAPAVDGDGRRCALKLGWLHVEARHEAEGLRAFGGDGAVRLYDSYLDGDTSALLLEPCDPGTPLRTRPVAEQDEVIAGLLRRLWRAPVDGPFATLSHMCREWTDEFERHLARATGYDLDPGLVRAGAGLFRTLPGSAGRPVLLVTDLHSENVLAARREPWLAIDPKPFVGDPAYDVLQHLCTPALAADPGGRCDRMADLLDLDRHRVRQWTFARCVIESIEQPFLRDAARALAPA